MKFIYTCDWCHNPSLWIFRNPIKNKVIICTRCYRQYKKEHSIKNHNKRIEYKKNKGVTKW